MSSYCGFFFLIFHSLTHPFLYLSHLFPAPHTISTFYNLSPQFKFLLHQEVFLNLLVGIKCSFGSALHQTVHFFLYLSYSPWKLPMEPRRQLKSPSPILLEIATKSLEIMFRRSLSAINSPSTLNSASPSILLLVGSYSLSYMPTQPWNSSLFCWFSSTFLSKAYKYVGDLFKC